MATLIMLTTRVTSENDKWSISASKAGGNETLPVEHRGLPDEGYPAIYSKVPKESKNKSEDFDKKRSKRKGFDNAGKNVGKRGKKKMIVVKKRKLGGSAAASNALYIAHPLPYDYQQNLEGKIQNLGQNSMALIHQIPSSQIIHQIPPHDHQNLQQNHRHLQPSYHILHPNYQIAQQSHRSSPLLDVIPHQNHQFSQDDRHIVGENQENSPESLQNYQYSATHTPLAETEITNHHHFVPMQQQYHHFPGRVTTIYPNESPFVDSNTEKTMAVPVYYGRKRHHQHQQQQQQPIKIRRPRKYIATVRPLNRNPYVGQGMILNKFRDSFLPFEKEEIADNLPAISVALEEDHEPALHAQPIIHQLAAPHQHKFKPFYHHHHHHHQQQQPGRSFYTLPSLQFPIPTPTAYFGESYVDYRDFLRKYNEAVMMQPETSSKEDGISEQELKRVLEYVRKNKNAKSRKRKKNKKNNKNDDELEEEDEEERKPKKRRKNQHELFEEDEDEEIEEESRKKVIKADHADNIRYQDEESQIVQANVDAVTSNGMAEKAPDFSENADIGSPHRENERVEFHMRGFKGPESYKFGFDTGKGENRQFRLEERDARGRVKGHYGYYDNNGKLQVFNYEADPESGYRMEKQTENANN